MKKVSFFSLVVLLFLTVTTARATCTGSGLIWSCPSGASVSDVQTAINSATDGATITFANGSYTWASVINPVSGKGLTLICASVGGCNVNIAGSGEIDGESMAVDKPYRISGFNFVGPGASIVIMLTPLAVGSGGAGTLNNFRIDHNTFTNLGFDAIAIMIGDAYAPQFGTVSGLIDHNTFGLAGNVDNQMVKILGPSSGAAAPTSPKGTVNNVFIEDNTWYSTTMTDSGSGCIDIWDSGAVVFRHNTTTNCLVTAHEEGHGGGSINLEAYNNNLTAHSSDGTWIDGTRLIHHQGSGEFFVFNNSFTAETGKSGNALEVTDYRSCPIADTGSGFPTECDGTQAIDGNDSPTGTYYGYPCWRQSGRMNAGSDSSTGQPGSLSPVYVWNNYWSDTLAQIPIVVSNPWSCPGPPTPATHLVSDRDYYNAVSASAQSNATTPFDGTTGMGFGTLANRPTTCTTNALESGGGVGYFATDQGAQGTLYRCDSTNHWTVQYTPYQYPHPLNTGGAGSSTSSWTGAGVTWAH